MTEKADVIDIQVAVAAEFGIALEALLGSSRVYLHAKPRLIAMYLVRERLGLSFPVIGRYFERDHTSIVKAGRSVRAAIAQDAATAARIDAATARIAGVRGARQHLADLRLWHPGQRQGPMVRRAPEPPAAPPEAVQQVVTAPTVTVIRLPYRRAKPTSPGARIVHRIVSGCVPLGEPLPGRSALDQRRAAERDARG